MADDWQVGDLALCVCRDGGENGARWIEAGAIVEVAEVEFSPFWPGVGLGFVGFPVIRCSFGLRTVYQNERFRKIRPHAPDAEDAETIRLMRGKPARVEA